MYLYIALTAEKCVWQNVLYRLQVETFLCVKSIAERKKMYMKNSVYVQEKTYEKKIAGRLYVRSNIKQFKLNWFDVMQAW